MADVINYRILKCLFTEMNSVRGLMVINSQYFQALVEPRPLLGGLGWTSLGKALAGCFPPLTRGWSPDC